MNADHVTLGMHDVDSKADNDIAFFATKLAAMCRLDSFAAYKRQAAERLAVEPGDAVLDVGCGLGQDVVEIATAVGPTGRAVGVDASGAFVEHARRAVPTGAPQLEFVHADGERLPFEPNSFDAAKIDRTLQHAARPEKIVAELYRVLKPGGRMVCVEPDWETMTLAGVPAPADTPAAAVEDRDVTRLVLNHWCDHYRQGWIGRRLAPLLRSVGLVGTEVTGHLLTAVGQDDIETAFFWDVAGMVENAKRQAPDAGVVDAWFERYRAAQEGTLTGTLTLFMASGVKPG